MKSVKDYDGGVMNAEVAADDQKVFAKLTFDKGFKIVLGTEGRSEKILISLLNRILDFRVTELQFLQTEKVGLTEEDGESVFDVYCKDDQGRRFLVEMQMGSQAYFDMRSGIYLSLAIMDQSREARLRCKEAKKKWNYHYDPVYVISFLNYKNNISEDPDLEGVNPYISHYITRSKVTGQVLNDSANRIFVDLYRFNKQFEDCCNDFERWLFSIKYMHLLKELPDGIDGTELEDLYYEAKLAAWKPDLRTKYERLMANELDREISMEYERQLAREAGLAEGLAEGKAEASRDNAKALKALGVDVQIIAKGTGLTVEEVNSL